MALAIQTASTVLTAHQFDTSWCVYEHHVHLPDGTREFIFIGACALQDVYRLKAHKTNPKWVEATNRMHDYLYINITHTGDQMECTRHVADAVRTGARKPKVLPFYRARNSGYPVKCVTTGEVFPTQQAAAIKYGISQGALSKHLRGIVGHATVGGYTFENVVE